MADAISSDCGDWTLTADSWPWPMAYFGEYYTIAFAVCDTDDCESGIASGDDQLVLFELYNASDTWYAKYMYDFGSISNIDHVDVLDFNMFYAVTAFGLDSSYDQQITSAFRYPGETAYGDTHGALPDYRCPEFGTGCNFKGQAIIGNIYSTDEYWEQIGKSGVCWSAISKFDFRPDERTSGYRVMPWGDYKSGMVYKIRRLGDVAMVYGDGGMAALVPAVDPVTTFGLKEMRGAGIASFYHMAGDEQVHLFLDNRDDLWMIGQDLKPQKLGYREWMQDLTNANIVISYVPSKKRFYIADGTQCFVLTEYGMYETHQIPSCVGDYRNSVLAGFFVDSADYEARVTSGVLDFGLRCIKTLAEVEISGDYYDGSDTPLKTSTYYRYDHKDSGFTQTSWINFNDTGFAMPIVSAPEMKISVKADDYRNSTLNLDSLTARLKVSDKRGIRGMYAGNANS